MLLIFITNTNIFSFVGYSNESYFHYTDVISNGIFHLQFTHPSFRVSFSPFLIGGKKNRQKERRLMKGFNLALPGAQGMHYNDELLTVPIKINIPHVTNTRTHIHTLTYTTQLYHQSPNSCHHFIQAVKIAIFMDHHLPVY